MLLSAQIYTLIIYQHLVPQNQALKPDIQAIDCIHRHINSISSPIITPSAIVSYSPTCCTGTTGHLLHYIAAVLSCTMGQGLELLPLSNAELQQMKVLP